MIYKVYLYRWYIKPFFVYGQTVHSWTPDRDLIKHCSILFNADIFQLKSVLYSQSVLYSHNLTRSFLDWTPILYSKRFSILGDVVSQIMKPLVIWGHELIFQNWPQVLTARSGVLSKNIHYRQMILRSTMLFKCYSLWIVISADTSYLVR